MRLAILPLAALFAGLAGPAGACTVREYAQYKDRARTDVMGLAKLYCLNKDLWDIRRKSGVSTKHEVDECGDELPKIGDAIETSKRKAEAFKYIERHCPIK